MRIKASSYVGKKFNRWKIVGVKPPRYFECVCECGTERLVFRPTVIHGMSKSCGCFSVERARERQMDHGHAAYGEETPEFRSWSRMRHRCNCPTATQYKHYGGRGIKICKRWDNFSLFLEDVGPWPGPGYTLERKDNHGDYKPGNVRWATMKEQANNRRNNLLLTLNGETMTVSLWADRIKINAKALYCRKDMGWSDEETLTRPLRKDKRTKPL